MPDPTEPQGEDHAEFNSPPSDPCISTPPPEPPCNFSPAALDENEHPFEDDGDPQLGHFEDSGPLPDTKIRELMIAQKFIAG